MLMQLNDLDKSEQYLRCPKTNKINKIRSLERDYVANPRDIFLAQDTGTFFRNPTLDFFLKFLYGLDRFILVRKQIIPHYGAKIAERIFSITFRVNVRSFESVLAPSMIKLKYILSQFWFNSDSMKSGSQTSA